MTDPEKKYSKAILRKDSGLSVSKDFKDYEFSSHNNSNKYKKRDSNTSSNYKPISDFSIFDNNNNLTLSKMNSLKSNMNLNNLNNLNINQQINSIYLERENNNNNNLNMNNLNHLNLNNLNMNTITKNYWKNSPKNPNRIYGSSSKKLGFTDINSKFFGKIN